MKLINLWNLMTSRKRFRNYYDKSKYVENMLRTHLVNLCKEFNIDEVPFRCSTADNLLYNANIMRAAQGIEPRTTDLARDSFLTTMHACGFSNGITHNQLIGIIANMDNIMNIVKYADSPYLVDKFNDTFKLLMKHEIGHVIVESSIYEDMSPNEANDLINSRKLEEERAMIELRKLEDNRLFAEGYFQIRRESAANAAVGISLATICDLYAKL